MTKLKSCALLIILICAMLWYSTVQYDTYTAVCVSTENGSSTFMVGDHKYPQVTGTYEVGKTYTIKVFDCETVSSSDDLITKVVR